MSSKRSKRRITKEGMVEEVRAIGARRIAAIRRARPVEDRPTESDIQKAEATWNHYKTQL